MCSARTHPVTATGDARAADDAAGDADTTSDKVTTLNVFACSSYAHAVSDRGDIPLDRGEWLLLKIDVEETNDFYFHH